MKILAKLSEIFTKSQLFYALMGVSVVAVLLRGTTSVAVESANTKSDQAKILSEIQSLSDERKQIDEDYLSNESVIKQLQESNKSIKSKQSELANQAKEKRIEYVQQYGCSGHADRCDLLKVEVVQKIEFRTNSNGSAKALPDIDPTLEAFASEYGLDAQDFIDAGKEYNIKPEVILCIARADSDLGRATKSKNNLGNVGNNDRGDTVEYDTVRDGIFAIGKTLNNSYLGNKTTIQDLSYYGNCETDCQYIYASSTDNRENNVMNCLNFLYGNI